MSDAKINYEHTVANCTVPPGWEIVNPENMGSDLDQSALKFLNADRVWVDFMTSYHTDNFSKLWDAGCTVLIKPAPVPMELPRPTFVPPPAPVPAAPTVQEIVPAPVALPVAAPAPALVLPATPQIQLPKLTLPAQAPAPAALPPAPVAAAPAFVPPSFTPPAPVAAPVVSEAPALPPMPLALPSAVQPLPAAPEPDAEYEREVEGGMDTAALYTGFKTLHEKSKEIEKLADDMRKQLLKILFPEGIKEGTQTAKLADGTVLKVVGKINRTLDEDALRDVLPILRVNGVMTDELFPVSHDLSLTNYRKLPDNIKLALVNVITEKPGKPVISEK